MSDVTQDPEATPGTPAPGQYARGSATGRPIMVLFDLLGRRWDHSVLVRFIEERRSLAWVIEHLREAAFDTEFVPPLRIPREARGA